MDDIKHKFKVGDKVLLHDIPNGVDYYYANGTKKLYCNSTMHSYNGETMTISHILGHNPLYYRLEECWNDYTYHEDHLKLAKNNYKIMMDFAKQNRS